MSRAAFRRGIGALRVAAALSWCAGAVLAQTSSDGETRYGPRDIGGTWERYPSQFAGLGSDDSAPPRPQPVPDPPLKPEYYAEWRNAQDEAAALTAAGKPPATHYTHCIGDGMPGMMMAMFPMEVLVTGDQVTVIQEAYNQVRRIYIGEEPPPPEDAEPRFAGHSGARWEGDTLVVETTHLVEQVDSSTPHSDQAKIVERYTLGIENGRRVITNEWTMTDPVFLTAPMTGVKRWQELEGGRLMNYECTEPQWADILERLLAGEKISYQGE